MNACGPIFIGRVRADEGLDPPEQDPSKNRQPARGRPAESDSSQPAGRSLVVPPTAVAPRSPDPAQEVGALVMDAIADMWLGRTVDAMYITQEHNQWPFGLPRIAARLRQVVDLPGLSVTTRRNYLAISWINGPAVMPVFAELHDRLSTVVPYRAVRLYPVAVFGAALLTASEPPFGDRQFRTSWQMLHHRDLVEDPFGDELVTRGGVLGAIAGAPATAVVGWGRRRWDAVMWRTLQQLGDPSVLEAVCAPPGA
jgi:hypothetical protein